MDGGLGHTYDLHLLLALLEKRLDFLAEAGEAFMFGPHNSTRLPTASMLGLMGSLG